MKSKYETAVLPYLEQIKNWVRDGATDDEVSERLGIHRSTFYLYKSKYSDFADALKKTKEIVDAQVVGALYKRAMGYDVTEYEEVYDGQGNLVSKKKKIRHIPPDPTSMAFWLQHRQKMQWTAAVEATDSDTGGVIMISQKNIIEVPKDE